MATPPFYFPALAPLLYLPGPACGILKTSKVGSFENVTQVTKPGTLRFGNLRYVFIRRSQRQLVNIPAKSP